MSAVCRNKTVSTAHLPIRATTGRSTAEYGVPFAAAFSLLVMLAAGIAAWLPVQMSVAIVFLFAGPHNLLEARYMLGRLPARAGRLRPFFMTACIGAVGLTASFAALPWAAARLGHAAAIYATWNTAMIIWTAAMVLLRSRANPRFDAGWVPPVAGLLILAQWPWPWYFNLAIVFLHPLVALVVLDREIRRWHPSWIPMWRLALMMVPAGVAAIWAFSTWGPHIQAITDIDREVIRHAGAGLIDFTSTRCVVAVHAFLELIHYGVWIVLIPFQGMRSAPWQLQTIPLTRRGRMWTRAVAFVLVSGVLAVGVLWGCFAIDYGTTRQVYFTVAVLHVLAEIPLLLRMT